jgi:hypothetical protein
MGQEEIKQSTPQSDLPTKVIHVQVIDGSQADIHEIGKAISKFTSNVQGLPYKLEAIVSNNHVVLRDVGALITELEKLYEKILKEKIEQMDKND